MGTQLVVIGLREVVVLCMASAVTRSLIAVTVAKAGPVLTIPRCRHRALVQHLLLSRLALSQ